jgi:hypothetical protein
MRSSNERAWDSPRFIGVFPASGLYGSQAGSRPAYLRLTQAVSRYHPGNESNLMTMTHQDFITQFNNERKPLVEALLIAIKEACPTLYETIK